MFDNYGNVIIILKGKDNANYIKGREVHIVIQKLTHPQH